MLGAAVATNTATITAVDTAKAVVLFGGFSGSGDATNSEDLTHMRVTLTNTTTVTATRVAGDISGTVDFQVLEYV